MLKEVAIGILFLVLVIICAMLVAALARGPAARAAGGALGAFAAAPRGPTKTPADRKPPGAIIHGGDDREDIIELAYLIETNFIKPIHKRNNTSWDFSYSDPLVESKLPTLKQMLEYFADKDASLTQKTMNYYFIQLYKSKHPDIQIDINTTTYNNIVINYIKRIYPIVDINDLNHAVDLYCALYLCGTVRQIEIESIMTKIKLMRKSIIQSIDLKNHNLNCPYIQLSHYLKKQWYTGDETTYLLTKEQKIKLNTQADNINDYYFDLNTIYIEVSIDKCKAGGPVDATYEINVDNQIITSDDSFGSLNELFMAYIDIIIFGILPNETVGDTVYDGIISTMYDIIKTISKKIGSPIIKCKPLDKNLAKFVKLSIILHLHKTKYMNRDSNMNSLMRDFIYGADAQPSWVEDDDDGDDVVNPIKDAKPAEVKPIEKKPTYTTYYGPSKSVKTNDSAKQYDDADDDDDDDDDDGKQITDKIKSDAEPSTEPNKSASVPVKLNVGASKSTSYYGPSRSVNATGRLTNADEGAKKSVIPLLFSIPEKIKPKEFNVETANKIINESISGDSKIINLSSFLEVFYQIALLITNKQGNTLTDQAQQFATKAYDLFIEVMTDYCMAYDVSKRFDKAIALANYILITIPKGPNELNKLSAYSVNGKKLNKEINKISLYKQNTTSLNEKLTNNYPSGMSRDMQIMILSPNFVRLYKKSDGTQVTNEVKTMTDIIEYSNKQMPNKFKRVNIKDVIRKIKNLMENDINLYQFLLIYQLITSLYVSGTEFLDEYKTFALTYFNIYLFIMNEYCILYDKKSQVDLNIIQSIFIVDTLTKKFGDEYIVDNDDLEKYKNAIRMLAGLDVNKNIPIDSNFEFKKPNIINNNTKVLEFTMGKYDVVYKSVFKLDKFYATMFSEKSLNNRMTASKSIIDDLTLDGKRSMKVPLFIKIFKSWSILKALKQDGDISPLKLKFVKSHFTLYLNLINWWLTIYPTDKLISKNLMDGLFVIRTLNDLVDDKTKDIYMECLKRFDSRNDIPPDLIQEMTLPIDDEIFNIISNEIIIKESDIEVTIGNIIKNYNTRTKTTTATARSVAPTRTTLAGPARQNQFEIISRLNMELIKVPEDSAAEKQKAIAAAQEARDAEIEKQKLKEALDTQAAHDARVAEIEKRKAAKAQADADWALKVQAKLERKEQLKLQQIEELNRQNLEQQQKIAEQKAKQALQQQQQTRQQLAQSQAQQRALIALTHAQRAQAARPAQPGLLDRPAGDSAGDGERYAQAAQAAAEVAPIFRLTLTEFDHATRSSAGGVECVDVNIDRRVPGPPTRLAFAPPANGIVAARAAAVITARKLPREPFVQLVFVPTAASSVESMVAAVQSALGATRRLPGAPTGGASGSLFWLAPDRSLTFYRNNLI